MIYVFREILISVTITAIFCAVLLSFIKDSAIKEVIKVTAGLLMTIAVLNPILTLKTNSLNFESFQNNYNNHTQKVQKENDQLEFNVISSNISSYIKEKANELGIECNVQTYISYDDDNHLVIDRIDVSYIKDSVKESHIKQLSEIIESECGVASEKQRFKEI